MTHAASERAQRGDATDELSSVDSRRCPSAAQPSRSLISRSRRRYPCTPPLSRTPPEPSPLIQVSNVWPSGQSESVSSSGRRLGGVLQLQRGSLSQPQGRYRPAQPLPLPPPPPQLPTEHSPLTGPCVTAVSAFDLCALSLQPPPLPPISELSDRPGPRRPAVLSQPLSAAPACPSIRAVSS